MKSALLPCILLISIFVFSPSLSLDAQIDTMTFETGKHPDFNYGNWKRDATYKVLYVSTPNVNTTATITKKNLCWDLISFQTKPFVNNSPPGSGTWRAWSDLGHEKEFKIKNYANTITLNWVGIRWMKLRLIENGSGNVNNTFDFDNVIFNVPVVTAADQPILTNATGQVCPNDTVTVNISGNLNDASQWVAYSNSCGSGKIGSMNGASFDYILDDNTTLYFRGEDICVDPGLCDSIVLSTKTYSTQFSTISASLNQICGGEVVTLSANGGIVGTGATTNWYDAPWGGGNFIGTGTSIEVMPTITTTYYARREGDCNFSNDVSITVTVDDTTAPIPDVTNLPVINADCTTTLTAPTATDNCGGIIEAMTDDALTYSTQGTFNHTWTYTDESGNTATQTQIVIIQDQTSPAAQCQNIILNLDASGMATTTTENVDNGSSDACGISIYSLSQTEFNCTHIGDNAIILTVTDNHGNSATCQSTISVQDLIAPTALCQNVTIMADTEGNATLGANAVDKGSSDNCSIESLSISQTTFSCEDIGTAIDVILTVNDASGNQSTCLAIVQVEDNTAQIASCNPVESGNASHIIDQAVNIGLEGTYTWTQEDIDALTISSYDNCGITSRTVWPTTIDCSDIGTTKVFTISLSDASGNTSNCTITYTNIVDQTPPVANCQDILINLSDSGNQSIIASQVDDNSSDACGIASFLLSKTEFDCTDLGDETVQLTVTDNSGNTSTCQATVTTTDITAPIAQCQNVEVNLNDAGNASIQPSDIDDNSSDQCSISSSILSQTDFTCDDLGENTVILDLTDASGNTSNCTAVVTIIDATAPTAQCQDVTVQLDGYGSATLETAMVDANSTDICGIENLSLNQTLFTCDHIGENTVVLTVADLSGNTASCTASITIEDHSGPVAQCENLTINLDASGVAAITADAVGGYSSDACGITNLSLSQYEFNCSDAGENEVQLEVIDENGNYSQCTAIITVVDQVNPQAFCQNISIQLDEGGEATISVNAIDNGSTDMCGIASLNLDRYSFDCEDTGDNTVLLTAIDQQGNTAQCTALVEVVDEIAPIARCQNITIQLDENGQASILAAAVNNGSTDACGIASMTLDNIEFDCGKMSDNVVQLSVVDNHGNSAQCTAIITIEDRIPPSPMCKNKKVFFNGEDQIALSVFEVYDDYNSYDNCEEIFLLDPTDDWILSCSQVGTSMPVTISVEDGSGNMNTCVGIISIEGLPCGWSDGGGIGDCGAANSSEFDVATAAYSLSTNDCMPAYPYNADEVAGVFHELCGDGAIIAEVTNIEGSGFAGVMLRETKAPGAPMLAIGTNRINRIRKEVRMMDGYPAWPQELVSYDKFWLKLVRSGNMFQGFASVDGSNWVLYINQQIMMDENCIEAGIYLYSTDANNPAIADFKNVSIQSQLASMAGGSPKMTEKAEAIISDLSISAYPNPAASVLTVAINGIVEQEEIDFQLYNQIGQPVLRAQLRKGNSRSLEMDVSQLESGVYYLVYKSGDLVKTERIIVSH